MSHNVRGNVLTGTFLSFFLPRSRERSPPPIHAISHRGVSRHKPRMQPLYAGSIHFLLILLLWGTLFSDSIRLGAGGRFDGPPSPNHRSFHTEVDQYRATPKRQMGDITLVTLSVASPSCVLVQRPSDQTHSLRRSVSTIFLPIFHFARLMPFDILFSTVFS